jgi:DNA-binding transcriptional regulator YdaS (Cro superfamily)
MASNLYEKLISHFGSPTEAARALRCRPSVVDNWRKRGLPPRRALEIEAATKGVISARAILTAQETRQ